MSTMKAVIAAPFLGLAYAATLPMAIWFWLHERAIDRRGRTHRTV